MTITDAITILENLRVQHKGTKTARALQIAIAALSKMESVK